MNESALRRVESGQAKSLTRLPFTLDSGLAPRGAIGLIVLATDNTIEHEFRRMLAMDGIAFYETRIRNAAEINPATLAEMEKGMAAAAGLIMPGVHLDVVAYGCTSGTVVIGEDKVFARIREARPDVACTTPITGAIAGLKALGASRVALLTPYIEEVNQMLRRFIEARGIAVPVMGSFNHENDLEVARISEASIKEAVHRLVAADRVDAVFVSCTSLRVAAIAEELEREVGVPVTSSNHAMAWHCLRLAGYGEPVSGFGSLFKV
ncbi:MAG TPA: aspartate/glutamate racemase family protein [Candidatus Udaeobacter sp.]|nr:aspartate/glutamate racemase family protein [Candidatus Udaeobacter sp.]